ncbi:MAG: type II secretion system protein GspK, partial [Prosthecobacter sp.]|nr:type II secretion system protein GspK [Prosthecobacter sp.]
MARCPVMLMDYRDDLLRRGTQTGSVLLAVLCLVAVLSFLIITSVSVAKQHGDQQMTRQGMMRARQLAEMGVAVAAHPQMKTGDPLLRREISSLERFSAVISTEEGRIHLNALLTEERLPVLERVFGFMGLSPAEAQSLAATLMDWSDADDLKRRPDSAEKLDYERLGLPGMPLNRPFRSLDEVELVPQMTKLTASRPDWRECFTLRGSVQLDVNTASADVIAAVTGTTLATAQQMISHRNGPDGRPHTQDDLVLSTVEEALALLGIAG